jgi:hypothetical protein
MGINSRRAWTEGILLAVTGIVLVLYAGKIESDKSAETEPYVSETIDNVANVINYSYSSEGGKDETVIPLKDCGFSFLEELNIPGMPTTREADLDNNYIFSTSQCPQGICFTETYVLLTSYSEEDDCLGELMVFDRESGDYLVTLGMDAKSHLGGVAFDGKNVWVCNSNQNTIERISYDFIELMATENVGDVVDATAVVDIYPVDNTPSCITCYGDRLWIATHTKIFSSEMVAYYYDGNQNELNSLNSYQIPAQVQGVAFDDTGRVYLSTSYGRKSSSYLKMYSSVVALSTEPGKPIWQIEMPPGSEEIDIRDDELFVLFESAGEKYYDGTDGKGKSLSPIDKILILDLSSI